MATDEKDDELAALLATARQGDKGSLNRLLHKLWPWLRKRAGFFRSRSMPLGVSSLAQETALRFSRSVEKARAADSPAVKALLGRIMRNTAVSAHRTANRDKRAPGDQSIDDWDSARDALPDHLLLEKEQAERLQEALAQLPQRQQVAVLRLWAGAPLADIAKELDCSVGAAQMLIQRAKSQLQRVLSADDSSLLDDGR